MSTTTLQSQMVLGPLLALAPNRARTSALSERAQALKCLVGVDHPNTIRAQALALVSESTFSPCHDVLAKLQDSERLLEKFCSGAVDAIALCAGARGWQTMQLVSTAAAIPALLKSWDLMFDVNPVASGGDMVRVSTLLAVCFESNGHIHEAEEVSGLAQLILEHAESEDEESASIVALHDKYVDAFHERWFEQCPSREDTIRLKRSAYEQSRPYLDVHGDLRNVLGSGYMLKWPDAS